MYCRKCGAQMRDDAAFCEQCGAPREQIYNVTPEQVSDPDLDRQPLLTMGIVAAALAELGIPGIIVGKIAQKKVQKYLEKGGQPAGKAKIGSILSKVGIYGGIGFTIFWTLYILLIVGVTAGAIYHAF